MTWEPGLFPQDGIWTSLQTVWLQTALWQTCSLTPWGRAIPPSAGWYWWGWWSGWQMGRPPCHCVRRQRLGERQLGQGLAKNLLEAENHGLPACVHLPTTPQQPTERKQHETRTRASPGQCLSSVSFWQNIMGADKGEKVVGSGSMISHRTIKDRLGAEIKKLLIGTWDYCARTTKLSHKSLLDLPHLLREWNQPPELILVSIIND